MVSKGPARHLAIAMLQGRDAGLRGAFKGSLFRIVSWRIAVTPRGGNNSHWLPGAAHGGVVEIAGELLVGILHIGPLLAGEAGALGLDQAAVSFSRLQMISWLLSTGAAAGWAAAGAAVCA